MTPAELHPSLVEALARLDARLLAVCAAEERRATLLAGTAAPGWAGVRNLAGPRVDELLPAVDGGPLVLPGHPVLDRLRTAHPDEVTGDLLLVLLAPYVEPRYQSLYAILQDDLQERRATERLVRLVLGNDDPRRAAVRGALAGGGSLVRTGLVRRAAGDHPPLATPLDLPEEVVQALLGVPRPAVPGARRTLWRSGTGVAAAHAPAVQVVHGLGDVVEAARSRLGAEDPLLVVDVAPSPQAPGVCLAAARVALATGARLLLDLTAWAEPEVSAAVTEVTTLLDASTPVWFATRQPVAAPVPHVEAVAPSWAERRDAWTAQARAGGVELEPGAAEALASRHRLDLATIADVVAGAADVGLAALSRDAAARLSVSPPSSRRTEPRHHLDDLVLAPGTRDALDRLVHFLARREELARDQDFAQRHRPERGPLVLFSGRSGTGKTAAAEGVAQALGRPLFTLDLSQLMSKYIGESEKNVDAVLRAAQETSGVLFCDEADALFSTRVEKPGNAGEHYANVLVGYLLQRIEAHEGVVILATNLRRAVDEAFLRRFRFRIEFPLPTQAERELIWDLMLPPGVPRAPGLDPGRVAQRDDVSGGDIANAALRAIFLADRAGTPLTQGLLEQAVALELMEQGRLSRPDPAGATPASDRGLLLRAFVELVQERLHEALRATFLKEVHIVHGSPSEERLAGRRPAVSLTLLRLAAGRGNRGLRAGFVASAWSSFPEEEYELVGVVHETLVGLELTEVAGHPARVRLHESSDFDLLHKFWSSHDRPVQASVLLDVEID